MARQVITPRELAAWMTEQIRQYEGCEEVEVGEPMELREPDEAGCNWSDSMVLRATGVPKELLNPAFGRVLAEARKRFNVE